MSYSSQSISLVLVPGLLPHPLHPDSGVRPNLDGRRLGRRHCELHRLHKVLGVAHEHLGRFLILLGSFEDVRRVL